MPLGGYKGVLVLYFLCFSYSYVQQTKLASSLVNFWAHDNIVFDWSINRLIDWLLSLLDTCSRRVLWTQVFDISDRLEVIPVPGHTRGSIAVYYASERALFSGDFVYECGDGSALIDWLPTSSVEDYCRSAEHMLTWLTDHPGVTVYPGHFGWLSAPRACQLMTQYVDSKRDPCGRCCTVCMQRTTAGFFLCGCFRCCPC